MRWINSDHNFCDIHDNPPDCNVCIDCLLTGDPMQPYQSTLDQVAVSIVSCQLGPVTPHQYILIKELLPLTLPRSAVWMTKWNLICWRHADIWSHSSHYPVTPPTPRWSHKSHAHCPEWSTHIPLVLCLKPLPFLKSGYFKLWPWSFKVKVLGMVKGQGHIFGPVSNWFVSRFFQINQTNNSWDTVISKFDLQGKGHGWGQGSSSHNSSSIQRMYLLFVSHQSDQPFLRYGQ